MRNEFVDPCNSALKPALPPPRCLNNVAGRARTAFVRFRRSRRCRIDCLKCKYWQTKGPWVEAGDEVILHWGRVILEDSGVLRRQWRTSKRINFRAERTALSLHSNLIRNLSLNAPDRRSLHEYVYRFRSETNFAKQSLPLSFFSSVLRSDSRPLWELQLRANFSRLI